MATLGNEMRELAAKGSVPKSVVSNLQNASYIKSRETSASPRISVSWLVASIGITVLLASTMS